MITPNVCSWRKTIATAGAVAKRLLSRDLHISSNVRQSEAEIPYFFRPDIHLLLRAITNVNPEKVHRPATYRSIGSGAAKSEEESRRFRKPKIELMTDDQLEKNLQEAPRLTHQRLQMPPVLPVREEIEEVLEVEPRLAQILPEGQRFVFTDISISDSITPRTRSIVAREADGTLRSVNWQDRDRFLSIYFPIQGQRVMTPLMFKKEYLETMLEQKKHLYILERACVQFEPDHPIFIETREAVYKHVLDKNRLDLIHATRHFGPLTLYAIDNDRHDEMIYYFIRKKFIRALVCYIQLLHKIKEYDLTTLPEILPVLEMAVSPDQRQWELETIGVVLEATRALLNASLNGEFPIRISDATMKALKVKLAREDYSQVVDAVEE